MLSPIVSRPRWRAPRRALLLVLAAVACLASFAPPALAGTPTTATVRVEGLNGETLLPQTTVTTTATPVPVEGGTCSGTSVGGALYDAVHGDWVAKTASGGVEILGIDGLDFPPFSATESPGIFWSIWVNDKFAEQGACLEELTSPDEHLVFFPQCFEIGPHCATATAPDHFLTSTPPTSAAVNVGEHASVTISSLNTGTATPEPALAAGVTVSDGAETVSPGAGGVTTFTFLHTGVYTLQARAPDSVPSDVYTVCVHNGDDGTCGTAAATTQTGSSSSSLASTPYTGPFALVADVTGLIDGRRYDRRHAPRVLTGSVTAHDAIKNVALRLTRTVRTKSGARHCSYYDGRTEGFRAMRCGAAHGRFFSVGSSAKFSYLLPFSLPRGRYVLDVAATDAAGNRAPLARGSSRVVFEVG